MDANQLRFFMLSEKAHWSAAEGADSHAFAYNERDRTLRLASLRAELPVEYIEQDNAVVAQRLATVPGSADPFGTFAYYVSVPAPAVMVSGEGRPAISLFAQADEQALLTSSVSDVALGHDAILYIACGTKLVLKDLRSRWDAMALPTEDFGAWRVAPEPSGGALVLEGPPSLVDWESSKDVRIARISGQPLPKGIVGTYAPSVFRPKPENTNPPRVSVVVDNVAFDGEIPVAIATSPEGCAAVLFWVADASKATVIHGEDDSSDPDFGAKNEYARLRLLGPSGLSSPIRLDGVKRPYSLTWLSSDRIAVLVKTVDRKGIEAPKSEAIAYAVDEGMSSLRPLGEHFPLVQHDEGPFLHCTVMPPKYPTKNKEPRPLLVVSLPSLATKALVENAMQVKQAKRGEEVSSFAFAPTDAGRADAAWHRLYIEAKIPPGTGIRVFLAATDTLNRPEWRQEADAEQEGIWHEHLFGELFANASGRELPRGVWLSSSSELPFHPGLLSGQALRDQKGLFTVLIQRSGRSVRTLRGRYLWVRIELLGDGLHTPELAALRAYASRFSYAEHYLPELYRESLFGEEADARGSATPADFLERFLGIAESVLTPLEDRIGSAFMLTDPRTVPEESLEWLAQFLGVAFHESVPVERRRNLLRVAPLMQRWHGTLKGLAIALDALTDHAVTKGSIIIVEDFKLRRTFSTILGADLEDADDPLLPGLYSSGNSYVGDTLFLGDEMKKEFLAVFGEGAIESSAERKAVYDFFERLAHRVTVLVHQEVDRKDLGLIKKMAEIESPAHIQVSVVTARYPFMVGIASLVGVDSFLGPPEQTQAVRIGESTLGVRDVLERLPSLDPRLQGG